ncbi:indole-3-glycerol-phosphate synthase [Methanothermobacter tenebrarum]|uniref:Indole-3-glycerol phosphate synthase n=1 Tax=Methanothermobacter tenebrarum TaxID=680118 RepID=A0ABN6PFN6_9EURY|nr:indole-3-glycerol phosphate synthase TrpC [Methanothermobacter tenebrarum]MDD3455253.1 indole-3-glycerol phosphate synthase TrpC [Methanobacteriales archaeon]MDI6882096.1 indole-3-glycerol phosphate synthase TrpC [Methanothermobacter sp.]BDH80020.1 indole-3-glycerol-phosphate synthase [Methanothermobacter tenebrarum]HOQ20302.1 indole-3-glycerol phosphate synthase TrpC [Methanothermobacter sp.]
MILEKIITEKKKEISKIKNKEPINDLKDKISTKNPPEDLKKALNRGFSIICEYKRASPSTGPISSKKLEESVKSFESGGASAISILTEKRFFNGDIKHLERAESITDIPILMKDFIIDEYQIFQARAYGASSILLIASICPNLEAFIQLSKSLHMEPLIECGNSLEICKALENGAEIIGINNRNLNNFTINLNRTKAFAPLIPKEKILVSESGVKEPEDVKILREYGADAILIGTGVMKSKNPADFIKDLLIAGTITPKGGPRIE